MTQAMTLSPRIRKLMDDGVTIPAPWSIEIGDDVDLDRIARKYMTFHSGTKIFGKQTSIGPGTVLGREAPVTIDNCQVGTQVELKGGYFTNAVFFDRSNMGSGSHVRDACILEEEANGAHTVGLKQTILFPFVTLGSLINFCDCFMSGGTSRRNHSEVGSSYIHFNYTPNQDKATASLIGDVPRGVMLNQPPIFLGGQGGLVGPVQVGYGTVTAAGTILKESCHAGGMLITSSPSSSSDKAFHPGFYGGIRMKVVNNLHYIANLIALQEWYTHVRKLFLTKDPHGQALYEGAVAKLTMALDERIKRFEKLVEKMETSLVIAEKILKKPADAQLLTQQRELLAQWPAVKKRLTEGREKRTGIEERTAFLAMFEKHCTKNDTDYITAVQSLDGHVSTVGTSWLQEIIDDLVAAALTEMPSFL